MSKIAIITDTHHGARGDNQNMLNYQKKFFDDIFFPTLKERQINHVIHMGDIVDRRTSINFNTLKHLHEDFLLPLSEQEIYMDVICGNHDVYYKSTNELNAFDSIFGAYDQSMLISTYTEPTETEHGLFIPWINKENEKQSYDLLTNSRKRFIFGNYSKCV